MPHSAAQQGSGTVRLGDTATATSAGGSGTWSYEQDVPVLGLDAFEAPAPKKIGPYQIVCELGRGGMGVVYLAYSPELDRQVALKLLHVGANDEDLTRLRLEARALARASHPSVVSIHGVFEDAGRCYLVLDLVDGPSLSDRLKTGPLRSREAARIALALASALAHIHARGILHRDVKPSNVLLTSEGTPVLTDFGIARDTRRSGSGFTVTGAILGTPAYMSPEQAIGNWPDVDARSDVYSLGATLYAMLCGRGPFEGTLLMVLQSVVLEAPAAPSARAEGVDPALEAICLKAMSKRPEERYGSAADLAMALHAYLSGKPISTRVVILSSPVDDDPDEQPWRPRQRTRQRPRQRTTRVGRSALSASLGALFALALGVPLASVLSAPPAEAPVTALQGELASLALGEERAPLSALVRSQRSAPAGSGEEAQGDDAPRPPTKEGGERQTPGAGEGMLALQPPASLAGELDDSGASEPFALKGAGQTSGGDAEGDAEGLFPPGFAALRAADPEGAAERPDASEPDEESEEVREPESSLDEAEASGTSSEPPANPVSQALLAYSSAPQPAGGYAPYDELVSDMRDAKGYDAARYYNDAATQRPELLAGYGEAILVGHSTRVDWIVGGKVYGEVQLAATIRGATVAEGRAFVATADAAVQGSGDVYLRGLDGRWAVSLDGAGTGAVVGRLKGEVYAALAGPPGAPATVHRFDGAREAWEQVATLEEGVPTELIEFMGELWIVTAASTEGDSIHQYSGSGRQWVKEDRVQGSKKLDSDERVRGTASLVVRGNLFVATVIEDVVSGDVESELLVYEADRKGEKQFKRLDRVKDEAILCLAYQDRTLYAGTSQGRLLYLERKLDKEGKIAKKFGVDFEEDPSIGLNGGISSLLPIGQGTLLVGLAGNAGTEILRRSPRPAGAN